MDENPNCRGGRCKNKPGIYGNKLFNIIYELDRTVFPEKKG